MHTTMPSPKVILMGGVSRTVICGPAQTHLEGRSTDSHLPDPMRDATLPSGSCARCLYAWCRFSLQTVWRSFSRNDRAMMTPCSKKPVLKKGRWVSTSEDHFSFFFTYVFMCYGCFVCMYVYISHVAKNVSKKPGLEPPYGC